MFVWVDMPDSSSHNRVGEVVSRRVIDGVPHYTLRLLGGGRHTLPVARTRRVRNR